MAPPKRPWFRFYVEALTDPKLRRLTPEERWVWIAVLGAARQSCDPGRLMLTQEVAMNFEDLSELSGVNPRRTEAAVKAMQSLGLVTVSDGVMEVPAWSSRQYESDDSAKRVQKHRDVTPDGTSIGRYIAVDVTPPDTETDTDTHIHRATGTSEPDDFASFWAAYPRKVNRKKSLSAWSRLTQADRAAALEALPVHIAAWRRSHPDTDQFIPHSTTWLHGRRWEDQVTSGRPQLRAVGAGGVEIDGAT